MIWQTVSEKAYRPWQALPRTAFLLRDLCGISTADYLSGGNVCCLYGTYQTGNQQGTSRRYQLRCGVHSVGFVYCLCSRLYKESQKRKY